jgi:feruloyl esterase
MARKIFMDALTGKLLAPLRRDGHVSGMARGRRAAWRNRLHLALELPAPKNPGVPMVRISALRLGALLLAGFALPALSATPCAALKDFHMPGYNVAIDSAQQVAAGAAGGGPGGPPGPRAAMPTYCRVDGTIDKRVGRNGKSYAIGFSVALPDDWNGRFLFQGGGGLNGAVMPPTGAQYAGDKPALAQGFAIASTDSGHKGSNFDATFMEDQEAALNFLYGAIGKVTVVAKEIIAQRYGKPADHSYFVGCSTGGREAMITSQRYPMYFDGIVAGAPAMRTGYSNLGLRYGATALNAIAPKDKDGKPVTRDALSDADRKLVSDAMLGACDALDGAKDGLVFAAPSCKFDPKVLACKGEKTPRCLSSAQVAAVKKVMTGPKASDGRQVYPGYLWDTGITTTRGGLPGVLVGPPIPEGDAPGVSMNVDQAAAQAHDGRSMAGDANGWTNLSSFNGHGGKLIFFHGQSDAWFSALDTVNYYERLAADNAPTPLMDWSRLFLVPGMGHCNGGERTPDRFDMVGAIVDWVENKHAPERIIATGNSMPGESRPLCPYPSHAKYDGKGDVKDAGSYSCAK